MSQQKNNHFSRKIIAVLEIIATFARDYQINPIGEVLEWLKRHAWKACSRQNRLAGSNPVLSAQKKSCKFCRTFFVRFILTIVRFQQTISRHGRVFMQAWTLLIWLNANIHIKRTISLSQKTKENLFALAWREIALLRTNLPVFLPTNFTNLH